MPRFPRPPDDGWLRPLIGPFALSLAMVIAIVALGGGSAFWLCVPVALLLARSAAAPIDAALVAVLAVAAAALPEAVSRALGPLPPVPLALAVVAASVWVQRTTRARADDQPEPAHASPLADRLTGVANRRGLDERIDYEVTRHTRGRRPFALIVLGLEGTRSAGERPGRNVSGELLSDAAEALRDAVREQDTVARLGGNEFCVLGPETDRAGAEHLAGRATAAIEAATAAVDGLSVTTGIGLFPIDGADGASILAAADAAQASALRTLHLDRTPRAA